MTRCHNQRTRSRAHDRTTRGRSFRHGLCDGAHREGQVFTMLNADPVISVVIPTFGRPEHLADTLASVAAQTYRNIECIVVDDCSDPPVEIAPVPGLDVKLHRHARNL